MRSVEGWVLELVDAVPELKPLLDAHHAANRGIDPEVFLSTAARWTRRQGPCAPVDRLLATLDRDYRLHGPKVRGIIESSFLERIADDPLVHRLGPSLRRALRPRDLGHGR